MKKTISLILSCLLAFSMLSCVNAATLDEATDAGETKIEYAVGETYTVVIPEEVVVAKDTETPVEYAIVVKDLLIPYGSSLDVSIEYEGKLKLFEHSATTLAYQIIKSSDSSPLSNGDKVISVPAGTVEEQSENITALLTEVPVIAGNYEDIVTFKINIEGGKSQYGEAIQMWEISATESDNVWMTYYQPKVASTYSARMTTTNIYEDGTIYITGTGEMEGHLYTYFLDYDKVIESVDAHCKSEYGYHIRVDEAYNDMRTFAMHTDDAVLWIDDEDAGELNGTEFNEDWLKTWTLDITDTSLYKFIPTKLVIDEGVTAIPDFAMPLAHFTSVSLPSSVETIGTSAFLGNPCLEEINLSEGLKTIGECAFQLAPVSSVVIPNTVTTIGASAFADCSNLTEITIPESVVTIDVQAFVNSNKLTTIKGVAGSYAETWANDNGYTFVEI